MEYVLLDNNCNESVIYNDKENDDELYIIGDEDDYVKNLTNTIFIKKTSVFLHWFFFNYF